VTEIDTSVQVAIVTGFFGLLAALTGLLVEAMRRQGKAIGEAREHAHATREQVQNSHTSTNLRDDVDQVLAALDRIEQAQRQYDTDINGLREEIRHERVERIDLEQRLDRHVDGHR
jgi:uncharacterized membrane protein